MLQTTLRSYDLLSTTIFTEKLVTHIYRIQKQQQRQLSYARLELGFSCYYRLIKSVTIVSQSLFQQFIHSYLFQYIGVTYKIMVDSIAKGDAGVFQMVPLNIASDVI